MCCPEEWERDREKGCAARGGEGCAAGRKRNGRELAWGRREWSWRGEEERGSSVLSAEKR